MSERRLIALIWNKRVAMVLLGASIALCFAISLSLSYFTLHENHGNQPCPQYNFVPAAQQSTVPTGANGLVFFKTHKTGSSTVNGILWRFLCEKQKLNCFMPEYSHPGKTWDFGKPEDRALAHRSIGTQNQPAPFHAWLSHAVRHDFIYNDIVNGTDKSKVQFVSIVRRPVARFTSAWTWYEHSTAFFPHYKLLGSISLGHPKITLERFTTLVATMTCQQSSTVAGAGTASNTITDAVVNPTTTAAAPIATQKPHYNSYLYTIFADQAERVLAWYVQYATRRMKYRTGLDATSEELVGVRTTDPTFEVKFQELLHSVASGELYLMVCDRYEESLLVLRKRALLTHAQAAQASFAKDVQSGASPVSDRIAATTSDAAASSQATAPPPTASSIFNTCPMPELLHLKQKQQPAGEPISANAAVILSRIQPHDTVLYSAANTMLNQHIAHYYGDMSVFRAELRELKQALTALETACSAVGTGVTSSDNVRSGSEVVGDGAGYSQRKEDERICVELRRDNRDLVQDAWRRLGRAPLRE